MGVKHAVNVTRTQGEARYVELHVRAQQDRRREKLEERMRDLKVYDMSLPYEFRERMPDLTDEDAREIAIAVDLAGRASSMRSKAMIALADLQNDAELQRELGRMNDEVAGGEGFESFYIVADGRNED